MVKRSDTVADLEQALAATVVFREDPDEKFWMIGETPTQTLHVRLGNFPDEELWSLYLGNDRWMDFTTPPAGWTLDISEAGWPDTARDRLPKGEFH
ncbi:hypothetical protein D5S18_04980 [Nocardia panacis]|uniref:Uncharacterized protein n=1 Tax=Nocardia panacis TaxID=2340916 RepID=A0A3A4KTB9_9NOCA|nr:hypothetical protein [Nocardia panacis]RJO78275.1 hypothetical protein D5S18_04980 [Nocardia panacis]